MARTHSPSPSSLALSNLRAITILIVVAFHSVLAYLVYIPVTVTDFSSAPWGWRSFPIIDSRRFFGFDLFCAWQDVYLMALFFFLSGLFVAPSLARKSGWPFLRDRLVRLGLPFVFGTLVLIPLAIYPAYLATASDPNFAAFLDAWLALPFWTNGPLWFLWQLLALNIVAAFLHWLAPHAIETLGRWAADAATWFGRYFVALIAISAAAYVPLAIAFTPWAWSDSGVLAVQFCRPLLYAVYFFAGVGMGAAGIDRGLVSFDGVLARYWARWLAAALVSLFVWMGLTALTMNGPAPVIIQVAADLGFVVACATGCFFVVAVSLRFAAGPSRLLDSLSANAYGLYLVHYNFVVWLQYALLGVALFAAVKAAIVFGATLLLSSLAILAVRRVPFGAQLIGAPRRAVATS
jgi:surface polysaccharide O-acyltransferase-like enzyme